MRLSFLSIALYATFISAKLLVSYDAAAKDPTSVLGLENLQGINRQEWPKGVANSSLYFKVRTKPPHFNLDLDQD